MTENELLFRKLQAEIEKLRKHEGLKRIADLKRGDIVRHAGDADSYVITGCYGSYATAVRTISIINPIEWEIVKHHD